MKANLRSLAAAGLLAVSSLNQSYAINTNDNYSIEGRTNNYSLENIATRGEIETEHKNGIGFPWPLGLAVGYMFILAMWPSKKKDSGGH